MQPCLERQDSKFAQLKIFHFRVYVGQRRRLWEGGSHSQMLWILSGALLGIQETGRKSPNSGHMESIPWCFQSRIMIPFLPRSCTQPSRCYLRPSVMDTDTALPRFSKLPYSSLELLLTASTCGLQQTILGCWNTQGKAARGRSWSLSIYPIGNDWNREGVTPRCHPHFRAPKTSAECGTSPASPLPRLLPLHILFHPSTNFHPEHTFNQSAFWTSRL